MIPGFKESTSKEPSTSGLQMKYFVLKPKGATTHAVASRKALLAYAKVIEAVDPEFARDLRAWERREAAAQLLDQF